MTGILETGLVPGIAPSRYPPGSTPGTPRTARRVMGAGCHGSARRTKYGRGALIRRSTHLLSGLVLCLGYDRGL